MQENKQTNKNHALILGVFQPRLCFSRGAQVETWAKSKGKHRGRAFLWCFVLFLLASPSLSSPEPKPSAKRSPGLGAPASQAATRRGAGPASSHAGIGSCSSSPAPSIPMQGTRVFRPTKCDLSFAKCPVTLWKWFQFQRKGVLHKTHRSSAVLGGGGSWLRRENPQTGLFKAEGGRAQIHPNGKMAGRGDRFLTEAKTRILRMSFDPL